MTVSPANLSIGVDIGGTKILAALVDEEGNAFGQIRRETPTTMWRGQNVPWLR